MRRLLVSMRKFFISFSQNLFKYFIKCLLCAKHSARKKLGVVLGTLSILTHFILMTILQSSYYSYLEMKIVRHIM